MLQIIALLSTVFLILGCQSGIANHESDIAPQDLNDALLFNWLMDTCFILSSGCGKLAVIALLLHVQGPTHIWGRRLLHFIGISNVLFTLNQAILNWFQCKPLQKLWEQEVAGSCGLTDTILRVGIAQSGIGCQS